MNLRVVVRIDPPETERDVAVILRDVPEARTQIEVLLAQAILRRLASVGLPGEEVSVDITMEERE